MGSRIEFLVEQGVLASRHMMPSNVEQVLLQGGSVTITTARFIVGATSYPLRGITSVTAVKLPRELTTVKWVAFFGVVLLVVVLSANADRDAVTQAITAMICAGPLFAIALVSFRRAKSEYVVRITTASGAVDAVRLNDLAATQSVVSTLNRALAGV